MWVPCGKCNFCLKKRRSEWSFRLYQEMKVATSAAFVTFTYEPGYEVYDVKSRLPALEKSHMQKFMKRVRYYDRKLRAPIKYYTVGEYGEQTGRPHYHSIMFNVSPETLGKISDIWGAGFVHIGKVEPASIAYVTGYVINAPDQRDQVRTFPFSCMSKGLGASYLTPQMRRWHKRGKRVYAVVNEGTKVSLPRYYKDKIFSKLEKRVNALKMEDEIDKRYHTEIERLAMLHTDPSRYYEEKVAQAYEAVKLTKSKF